MRMGSCGAYLMDTDVLIHDFGCHSRMSGRASRYMSHTVATGYRCRSHWILRGMVRSVLLDQHNVLSFVVIAAAN
jgi:hypothetical protein